MNHFIGMLRKQMIDDVRSLQTKEGWRRPRLIDRCVNLSDVRDLARRRLPRPIFDFVDGAANDEVTMGRNSAVFGSLAIRPRVLVDVTKVCTATVLQGQRVSMPILAGPTGLNGLIHTSGEAAVARAVIKAGGIYVLSMGASYGIEEVEQLAPGPKWFQTMIWKDRGIVGDLLDRAAESRYHTLVVTVDAPTAGRRERDLRNGLSIPPRVGARMLREGVAHPGWSARFVANSGRTAKANMKQLTKARDHLDLAKYVNQAFDKSLTWDDLTWVRDRWSGPLVVKGIIHEEDAALAARLGATGIIVSNHGGRQFDEAPSTLSALPRVVDAVGSEVEVYLDGGVRRGTDVLKAVALGARACLLGRPLIYGLGAAGERGVEKVMSLLSDEVVAAMTLSGVQSLAGVTRDYVEPAVPVWGAASKLMPVS